ncbi:MAG: transcriptional regulator [Deltaproteobacteria bacterium HGW-Deltaproteobacteria-13]|jgi:CRP/FNR family transcriptional regulator|nr:MAG: transcriptional regulator [Deltaproteobacteria bacterium HGW-Deltaproteobacteria-13]
MDIIKQIQDIALFRGVSAENLKLLASQAIYKKFKSGDLVIGETDQIRSFYVVIAGQLKLYKSSAEGREQTLSLLSPGDPFGLCTAFATDSFPASAMAIEESSVLIIPGELMEAIAKKEPTLLLNIIQILSQRLKDAMTLIESLALKEIPERLSAFLLHALSKDADEKKNKLELTISHRELSKILGSTPEALSRALRKMSNDRILVVEGRTITILDRQALEELAQGE